MNLAMCAFTAATSSDFRKTAEQLVDAAGARGREQQGDCHDMIAREEVL
jgi:hypothetical protein